MNEQQAAREIIDMIVAQYVPIHDYQPVDLRDFPHLDARFYEQVAAQFERRGFRRLGDIEDRTLGNTPANVFRRVLIRPLLSADGAIMLSLYHPRLKSFWLACLLFVLGKRIGKIVDCETEFTDGSFLCTSNALSAGAMEGPAMIDAEYSARTTPPEALLARRQQRVETRLRECPGLLCRVQRDATDVRASQNRLNALKSAFRGEIGGVSRAELERLAPSRAIAARVHEEIQNELAGRTN